MKEISTIKNGSSGLVKCIVGDLKYFLYSIGITPNVEISKIRNDIFSFRGGTFYIRPSETKIFVKPINDNG